MFLTILAFSMVLVFMILIMTKRLSAMTALILVPTVFAAIGGFRSEMGSMMLDGIRTIAPTATMLMFAILYFSVMIDTGLFDPLVNGIVRIVDGDPAKVVVGTAVLTLVVAVDGDGATTYMVTVAAMMPLYIRLGMNTLTMACVIMLSTSVMNVLPWGGPAARVASSLGVDVGELFVPMIPAMLGSAVAVVLIAYRLGVNERKRLGRLSFQSEGRRHEPRRLPQSIDAPGAPDSLRQVGLARLKSRGSASESAAFDLDSATGAAAFTVHADADLEAVRRCHPKLLWINLGLTILLMGGLLAGVLPLPVLFMIAFALALVINYPTLDEQKSCIEAYAPNSLAVSGLIFAAGIFAGVLSGTQMVDAMANAAIASIPDSFGPYMAVVAGLISIPGTFFISYDAFYFGVMPVVAQAGAAYGIDPVEIARASLIGAPVHALSPLTASTYLLMGLTKIELGDHQRFSLKWTLLMSLLMLTLLILTAAVSVSG